MNKDIPPLSEEEVEGIEKTYRQLTKQEKQKEVSDLTNQELETLHIDAIDSKNYVIDNQALYGANYDMALDFCNKLLKKCVEEKKKRGML